MHTATLSNMYSTMSMTTIEIPKKEKIKFVVETCKDQKNLSLCQKTSRNGKNKNLFKLN
jgi:hypothetical protein